VDVITLTITCACDHQYCHLVLLADGCGSGWALGTPVKCLINARQHAFLEAFFYFTCVS